MHPKPAGRFPLLVGGGGERHMIPIAARYADEWNVWATVAGVAGAARRGAATATFPDTARRGSGTSGNLGDGT